MEVMIIAVKVVIVIVGIIKVSFGSTFATTLLILVAVMLLQDERAKQSDCFYNHKALI